MARARDNWSRLVKAAVPPEHLGDQPSGLAAAVSSSRIRAINIETILEAADDIQAQDPNVARILCEQAYEMAQKLDPSSERRGVLQFKTGLASVIKQKLAKKGGSKIDRSNDTQHIWEFYQLYKQKNRVEVIQREERKWQQSGVFCTNVTQLMDTRKVFTTLRALIEVMECLSTIAFPETRISIMVMDEVKWFKFTGELTPSNIAPLDSPPLTNATGVFQEGMARVRDNWNRLVKAAIPPEHLGDQASGLAAAVSPSRIRATNIETILEAADEIQAQDPNVARILCEQAYEMAQKLDPISKGRGVLQFKTGLASKLKLAKKGGSKIDRSNDTQHIWEFYQLYKQKNRVEDIQREEEKWQQTGFLSCNAKQLTDMRKVFATLRALIMVMECLSTSAAPRIRISIMVMEELKRIKFTGELTPVDIAPSSTNAVGSFQECMARIRDNWSRLVKAADQASGLAVAVPPSRIRTTNIETILQVADEIQDQDPNVARILSEQAYDMAQKLDPSSQGRGIIQFKTGLTSVIKQKLCKRDGSQIDRSYEIERVWEFYQLYKQMHCVKGIQGEEEKWRQSGVLTSNATQLTDMKKVFANLRAMIEVMEYLSTSAAPRIRILIMVMHEVKRFKFTGELTHLTNAIGIFPEIPVLPSSSITNNGWGVASPDPASHIDWSAPNPPHSNVLPSAPPWPSEWPIYYPSIDTTPVEVSVDMTPVEVSVQTKASVGNMCVIC